MNFPVYLYLGPLKLHPHLFFETLAYVLAFRVYLNLRRNHGDALQDHRRWWVIAGAAVGALVGSKALFLLEDPGATLRHLREPALLFSGKTIAGALIGGLIAVEWIKLRLGIIARTGDLFALPLCLGIAIGRIGCFLTGLDDHTSGSATKLPWAVNFGDGIARHPTQLYEIIFLSILAIIIYRESCRKYLQGELFKIFMAGYFSFRLCVDFLKPDVRIFAGLSSIQWACIAMLIYYNKDLRRWFSSGRVRQARAAVPTDRPMENDKNSILGSVQP